MSKGLASPSFPNGTPAKKVKLEEMANENSVALTPSGSNFQFSEVIMLVNISSIEPTDSRGTSPAETGNIDGREKEIANPESSKETVRKKAKRCLTAKQFIKWQENEADIPIPKRKDWKKHWSTKPTLHDLPPHFQQPAARTSDAAVIPPLWEDRKFRVKRGNRMVKYIGVIAPDNVDGLTENLDQVDLLVLKLMDMRPKSKLDPTPKREPIIYKNQRGKPSNWNDKYAIKCINDRRDDAINRITLDAPWIKIEREYLASICRDFPNASIWEMTQHFNSHFMGQDFIVDTALSFMLLHPGRTIESIRSEYMTYKPRYVRGMIPTHIRYRLDRSLAGKALEAKVERAFGPPDKTLQNLWDKKATQGNESDEDAMQDDEEAMHEDNEAGSSDTLKNPRLHDATEEFLDLADAYSQDEIRASPSSISALTPAAGSTSQLTNAAAIPGESGTHTKKKTVSCADEVDYIQMSESEDGVRMLTNAQHQCTGAARVMDIDENYSDDEDDDAMLIA